MEDTVLLDSQAHELFALIKEHDLDPANFEWHYTKDTSTLSYKGTRWHCLFRRERPPWLIGLIISPADGQVRQHHQFNTFTRSLVGIRNWLTYLRRELSTPNLWAEIAREQELSSAATSQTEAHITPEEVQKLAHAVDEIKEFLLATATLNDEHRRFVETELNYLRAAALRQDRKAWMHTAVGVLLSIILETALPPDKARELFRMAGRLFTGVFQALSDPVTFVQGLLP